MAIALRLVRSISSVPLSLFVHHFFLASGLWTHSIRSQKGGKKLEADDVLRFEDPFPVACIGKLIGLVVKVQEMVVVAYRPRVGEEACSEPAAITSYRPLAQLLVLNEQVVLTGNLCVLHQSRFKRNGPEYG